MAKVGAKESKEKKWKDKEEKKKKKERKKQIHEHNKKFWRPWEGVAYLPDQVGNGIKHFWSLDFYVQEGGISKIWRAAPRCCSPASQCALLVLAPQEINTTRKLNEQIRIPSSKNRDVSLKFDDSDVGFTLYRCMDDTWHRYMDYNWHRRKRCTSSDEQFRFTNAIACGGKFYALSLQGTLAVIDVEDSQRLRATISIPAGVKRAIPSSCSSKGFREYLVRLDEKVLLILFVSRRSINVVDDVEVFRLDLTARGGWVKIQNLGDRTMFVGRKYCTHFSASQFDYVLTWHANNYQLIRQRIQFFERIREQIQLRYAKNFIYFDFETGAGWWVFDVRSGSLSPAQV